MAGAKTSRGVNQAAVDEPLCDNLVVVEFPCTVEAENEEKFLPPVAVMTNALPGTLRRTYGTQTGCIAPSAEFECRGNLSGFYPSETMDGLEEVLGTDDIRSGIVKNIAGPFCYLHNAGLTCAGTDNKGNEIGIAQSLNTTHKGLFTGQRRADRDY